MFNIKKSLVFLSLAIFILYSVSAVSFQKPIYDCMKIESEGNYILMKNLSLDDDCLVIDSNKVNIDGQGHFIFGDGGKGVKVIDSKYFEITNVSIIGFDYGIYFDDVKDSIIHGVNIDGEVGLEIRASDANSFYNNNILSRKYAIKLTTSEMNSFYNNSLLSDSKSVKLSTSDMNSFEMNLVNGEEGFNLFNSHKNSLSANIFEGDYLAVLSNSRENRFSDMNTSGNVELTDNSYVDFVNMSSGKEEIDSGSKLLRKWYYELYVIDEENNSIQGAYVLLKNINGYVQFATTSDENGYIGKQEVIEYVNNGRRVIDYNKFKLYLGNMEAMEVEIRGNLNGFIVGEKIPQNEEILITNITVNPSLPLEINESGQEIEINFESDTFPLFIEFILFNEDKNESIYGYNISVESEDQLPLVYFLNNNLSRGTYALNMNIFDSENNFRNIMLGYIQVNSNQSDDGTGSGGSDSSTGNGGSSGSGGSGGGRSSRGKIQNITSNNSLNNYTVNESKVISKANFTHTTSEEKGEVSGIAKITGAVIGAVNEAGWPFFVVLAILLAILYFVVFSKVEEDHETVVEEISEDEKLPDEVEEDKADVKNKNKKSSKK